MTTTRHHHRHGRRGQLAALTVVARVDTDATWDGSTWDRLGTPGTGGEDVTRDDTLATLEELAEQIGSAEDAEVPDDQLDRLELLAQLHDL